MTGGKKHREKQTAHDFPALRDFFSGYLHQDFRDEYGSAAGAAQAFRKDASEAELQAVRHEWNRWRAALCKSSADEIVKSARSLGAAWMPSRIDDLNEVEKALGG